jgi:hypothetical protein
MEAIAKKTENLPVSREFINQVYKFEEILSQSPSARFGDDVGELKHIFGDGLYIRAIRMKKGDAITTKIHKTNHPYFVLKGDISVITEDGVVRIIAPYYGMTKAGTKRILYINEETVWVTVHATKETDLEKIEEELIAKSYNELPEQLKEVPIKIDGKAVQL